MGITNATEDFSGQDRHLLSNATVFGLARDLAQMNHAQRVNAYCDMVRFLGVLFADLMRTMTRAEEIADEEALIQVTRPVIGPSIAPELAIQMEEVQAGEENEENEDELCYLEGMEIFDDLGEMNATEMVEGWEEALEEGEILEEGFDTGCLDEDDKQGQGDHAKDFVSYMQVTARPGPMTLFASHLARLQAHLESMTVLQRANIIKYLQGKLDKWREEWILALTSVSRDRADRLWALLITYQGEPGCIEDKDARWAEARWAELVDMLRIDAVRMEEVGPFRLPGTLVEIEDSQTGGATSSGGTTSSGEVMVQRKPQGPWEPATKLEEEELARKDADDEQVRRLQQQHDEELWAAHQAARARDWDDWAVDSEMNNPSSSQERPSKRFKIRVSVMDQDHNELDIADMEAEMEAGDVPVITVAMQEEAARREREAEPKGTSQWRWRP